MKYIVLIVIIFLPLAFSNAQNNLNLGQQTLDIDIKNGYLKPFSNNTASINDYSLPLNVNNIVWKIDGKTIPQATNNRSVDFYTGDINEDTTIEVFVETFEKVNLSIKKTLRPIYLDIVIEPQTKTPSFYQGRALPSIESIMNLTALVNGDTTNSENYMYTWALNDLNINGGSLRGKYKTSIEVPAGYQNIISVTITNLNGELVAKRSIPLPTAEAKLLFYETNTLYGEKHIPIKDTLSLISNSVSVKAEPYYVDIKSYNQPDFLEWKIDNNRSPSSGNNPYEVTLAKQQRSGVSNVSFRMNSTVKFLQGVQGDFKVTY